MSNCFGCCNEKPHKLQKQSTSKQRVPRSSQQSKATKEPPIQTDGPKAENPLVAHPRAETPPFVPTSYDVDALVLELNSNDEWEWSGGHRLSAIEEIRSEKSHRDSGSINDILERYTDKEPSKHQRLRSIDLEYERIQSLNRDYERLSRNLRTRPDLYHHNMSGARSPARSPEREQRRISPVQPRPIEAPPTDLEEISRIDASLVFEHFTVEDAWALGSALRTRLLAIPKPVVIDISLANQNQIVFRTVTHSGVMPDNDNWVDRKRRTVLRWGVSTWYMSCKFEQDEKAFAEKFALGEDAGKYAIHGGGIPIRVTGVEGVVAVVIVSGLKQHEDHAVIVEAIKELYY